MIKLDVAKVGKLPDITIKLDDAEFFELKTRVEMFIDTLVTAQRDGRANKRTDLMLTMYRTLQQKFEEAVAPFITA